MNNFGNTKRNWQYKTKKTSQKLKTVGVGILSAAVCMSSVIAPMSVNALTDPDNRGTYFEFTFDGTNPMLGSDNVTTAAGNAAMGTTWKNTADISGFTGINSDIHKNAYWIGASSTLDFNVYGTINFPGASMDAKPYVLSFEFFPMQDNVRYVTQMMATSGKVEVLFTVGSNGICGFNKAGGWYGDNPTLNNTSLAAAEYKTGQWNSVDIVIDPSSRERKYYINGEFAGDNIGAEGYTGMLKFMSLATGSTAVNGTIDPDNSGLLFDNVSVNYLDDSSFYSRISVSGGNEARIDFSETPTSTVKDIELYDSAEGKKISVSNVKACGKTVTFKTSEALSADKQYTIVYPEGFSSVGEHEISDRYLYFYPEKPSGAYVSYAAVTDYFGKTSGAYENISVVQDTLKIRLDGITSSIDVSNADITLTKVGGSAAELSAITAVSDGVTVKIDKFLDKNSEYVLEAEGIKVGSSEIPAYKTRFFTDDTQVDGYFNVEFSNSSGVEVTKPTVGKIYANTKFINTSDTDKTAVVMLAAYKNSDTGLKLMQSTATTVNIPAGVLTKVEKDSNELYLTVPITGVPDLIKGYVWTSEDDNTPYVTASSIGTGATGDSDITDGAKQIDGYNIEAAAEVSLSNAETAVAVLPNSDNQFADMVYTDQIKSDDNKRVAISFNMGSEVESGDYIVRFTSGGQSVDKTFVFVNPAEFEDVTLLLKGAADADEVEVVLKDGYAKLGISEELYASANIRQAAKLLYNDVKNNLIKDSQKEQTERTVELFYISAAANGSLTNIFDYAEELKLKDEANWEWYSKSFVTEAVQNDITSRLKKTSGIYADCDEFYDKLEEAYILAVVKKPDGEGNLKDVLNHFANEIGISQNGKSATYRGLMGDDYSSYSELKAAYEALEKSNSSVSGGGSSSSSGRGTGGSFSGSVMEKEYENTSEEDSAEPILKNIFEDLAGFEWAEQPIVYLAEKRIVTGKETTKFCPADSVTREEFAAMLVRAFASDAEQSDVSFSDTDDNEWYIEALGKAISAGIVKGNDDGSFGIGEKISRQDMVVMLSRAVSYASIIMESEIDNVPFNDDGDISDYAKDAVYRMKSARVVNGVTSDTFAPLDFASRAEAAKVIFNVLNV